MPAEEMLMECTESALQTIEYGPLPEVQRCMLMLSAMLTGASVDHGRRPVLVSLSTFSAADTKKLKNEMDNNNQATEESRATGLRLDSKIAESSLSEAYEGIQNTKQLKNGMDNNNQATEESQASDLRLDSNLAESCSLESKGSQKAAAHPAFSPFVPVVS